MIKGAASMEGIYFLQEANIVTQPCIENTYVPCVRYCAYEKNNIYIIYNLFWLKYTVQMSVQYIVRVFWNTASLLVNIPGYHK
jgi:hypothetical protein